MVVGCPKCKVKLKIANEKIIPEGMKFKCPKCSAVLLVKKPGIKPEVKNEKKTEADEAVEKAKRLARTIIADIYLYSSTKMEEAIKKNTFYTEFASDIKVKGKIAQVRKGQNFTMAVCLRKLEIKEISSVRQ